METKRRSRLLRRLAAAAFAAGLAGLFGTSLAQHGRADLFGTLPEQATVEQKSAPVHDAGQPATRDLQDPREAFSPLPRDKREQPDWARSLREGAIQPRTSAAGAQPPMQVLDLDIVMRRTAEMPFVKFPHNTHTQWLACTNCHDSIFQPKAGANPTSMGRILSGESCGTCHGKVAFSAMFTCERCHSVLQPGQKAWW
jgi:c(7)-type cytochrome triheme protein